MKTSREKMSESFTWAYEKGYELRRLRLLKYNISHYKITHIIKPMQYGNCTQNPDNIWQRSTYQN